LFVYLEVLDAFLETETDVRYYRGFFVAGMSGTEKRGMVSLDSWPEVGSAKAEKREHGNRVT
jgi:hypothetical protein